MQVRFERGTIATPELLQDIELPSSISVLGQPVDLTNLKVCSATALLPVSGNACLSIQIRWPSALHDRAINDALSCCQEAPPDADVRARIQPELRTLH